MQPLAQSLKRIVVGAILVAGVLFSVLEPATPPLDVATPECSTRNGVAVCFGEPVVVDRIP
jgi:hypothetical protein